jgi:hypothetical protein
MKSIVKAEEPMVSYERILLSQIDYCGKASAQQYSLCVDNLFSLLPVDLRVAVANEYDRIFGLIRDYVLDYVREKNLHCCKADNDTIQCYCTVEPRMIQSIAAMFKKEHPDLYLKHRHVLKWVIRETLNMQEPGISKSALMFSVMLNLLIELKIIGPRSTTPHIGRVEG